MLDTSLEQNICRRILNENNLSVYFMNILIQKDWDFQVPVQDFAGLDALELQ